MNADLVIYDTTLRDGSQSEGVSFSALDKLQIASELDRFGVDYIEGGWPGSNPKDIEFFERAAGLEFQNAKLAAFGSTRRVDSPVRQDINLTRLIETGTPVVTIFGKSWDFHVTDGLCTTLEINLQLIADSVAFLKDHGREVIYDAEHFFDGYLANADYALQTLAAALKAGADSVVLCDTNGGTLPDHLVQIIQAVQNEFAQIRLGIHAHNDSDTAVANSLAAVKAGLRHVQGTINGLGERCGNANLCSVLANLALKTDQRLSPKIRLEKLTYVSRLVSEIANIPHREESPYVGNSAFAHKGGIHVSAIRRNRRMYEHIDPQTVGNHQRVLISDQSGQSNILSKAEQMGIDIKSSKKQVREFLDRLKHLEHLGYQFEGADGSLQVLLKKATGEWQPFFELVSARVTIDKQQQVEPLSEAVLKIRVGGVLEHTAAEGNGPVDALDKALRKALEPFYPSLKKTTLVDYKVRVLNSEAATAAKVRVFIETADEKSIWGTVGVSENIIEASWQALVDSVTYKLMKDTDDF
ncbi:citramalate synthase [candidate division KSB1 bacterium]|nr:citramalate synthase [candidate division KSB1 bacterium]